MNYNKLLQDERDSLLKKELSYEKIKIIEKYNLLSTPALFWICKKENYHDQKVFKHSFLKEKDIITVLFRLYGLCYAKVKYFKNNINQFEPYKYHFEKGFIKTQIWDTEFFKHKQSGLFIDLRYLQGINRIDDFKDFCTYIENKYL